MTTWVAGSIVGVIAVFKTTSVISASQPFLKVNVSQVNLMLFILNSAAAVPSLSLNFASLSSETGVKIKFSNSKISYVSVAGIAPAWKLRSIE